MHEVYHPRRRSIPHTFEDRIEAEKTRLETQVARLRDGPKKDELLEKIMKLLFTFLQRLCRNRLFNAAARNGANVSGTQECGEQSSCER